MEQETLTDYTNPKNPEYVYAAVQESLDYLRDLLENMPDEWASNIGDIAFTGFLLNEESDGMRGLILSAMLNEVVRPLDYEAIG